LFEMRWPSSISASDRVVRLSRRAPSAASSAATCLLMALCVAPTWLYATQVPVDFPAAPPL